MYVYTKLKKKLQQHHSVELNPNKGKIMKLLININIF